MFEDSRSCHIYINRGAIIAFAMKWLGVASAVAVWWYLLVGQGTIGRQILREYTVHVGM
jgi:hypothetical protein